MRGHAQTMFLARGAGGGGRGMNWNEFLWGVFELELSTARSRLGIGNFQISTRPIESLFSPFSSGTGEAGAGL